MEHKFVKIGYVCVYCGINGNHPLAQRPCKSKPQGNPKGGDVEEETKPNPQIPGDPVGNAPSTNNYMLTVEQHIRIVALNAATKLLSAEDIGINFDVPPEECTIKISKLFENYILGTKEKQGDA